MKKTKKHPFNYLFDYGYANDEENGENEAAWLTAEIMAIMQKGLKAALDQALDELLGDWK